jgi:hypothetical protein
MKKIWVTCGWVLQVAGGVLVVMMGVVWLGGAEPIRMVSGLVMGCLFILTGWTFVARGRSCRAYAPTDNSEAAGKDQAAARRMIVQAIWIGGVIILGVALLVGLLMLLANPAAKP